MKTLTLYVKEIIIKRFPETYFRIYKLKEGNKHGKTI
jgi:hypothetical protein